METIKLINAKSNNMFSFYKDMFTASPCMSYLTPFTMHHTTVKIMGVNLMNPYGFMAATVII